jgi:aminopeptidase N
MHRSSAALIVAIVVAAAACSGESTVSVTDASASDTSASIAPSSANSAPDGTEPALSAPIDTAPVDETDATIAGSVPPPPPPPPLPGSPGNSSLDGVGDSLYPQMGNGGYDVGNYDLALDVDVAKNQLDAVAVISATTTQELVTFNFDLHGLDVTSVLVDDVDATYERDEDELVITPAEPVAADVDFVVEIRYAGVPEPIEDPAVSFDTVGWQNREDVVYVASEPSGAKSWFPSNNHPSDKATFTFEITTDSALTAVANGVQTSIVNNGDSSTTTWVMDDPMTTYLAAIYVGEFELRESTTASGLRIRNYFPPALADDLEAEFELTGDVIAFYEELFGAPYPFDEYGSIVLPFDTGFALENQSISVHGLTSTDADTIAHEILHQWAGDSVTVAQWQDIWMLEGFATYLSYLYFEDRGLESQFAPETMYGILETEPTTGPADVPIDELFGLSVYFRGGMALHALRTEVGDEAFRTILRTYYERNAGERVSTAEFQAIVKEISGSEAVRVLDEWLFGDDLPPFP